ncbi:efflux transporter outer membrane subunit [Salibacter sp.]|uniref:efflux transporter outer membrane subunit n=1 Tax=Salibacter sp. TaxID=2010995 RepID=UPI00287089D1|nr:efflux transporter outer membrane subunit [Salibacter sp.]MDR9488348.1 efflux transporter outer membrane subunit [Salibacter sp.]
MRDRYKVVRLLSVLTVMIVAIFGMQSCFVTKNYEEPKDEKQFMFRLDSLQKDDGEALGEVKWREFFSDPILIKHIDSALANNYNNQIALQNIKAADAYFKQSKMGFFPTLQVGAEAQRQQVSPNSRFGEFFNEVLYQYDLSASLTWEADIWGKIASQKRSLEAQFLQSVTAQQAVQTRLISNLANTYYQLLAADQRKQILEKTVLVRSKSLQTIKDLKQAGQTTQLAVNQSAAQVDEAKALLADVEQQIFTLENALSILMGEHTMYIERSKLSEQEFPDEFVVGKSASILANRPDVREAELVYRSSFEQANVARASMYPSVQLSLTGGFQSLETTNWISPNSFFTTLIGGITQPIFMRRQLLTQLQVSKSVAEQNFMAFKQTVLNAGMEVNNALKNYDIQNRKLEIRKRQEEHLTNALENAEDLLKNGYANYLEVLNVQESLLNIQLQRTTTESARLQSTTELYRALGGGVN